MIQLHHGDCLDVLKTLESESINTCVTSPPYYGLRDYGVNGQIGLEETPQEYVKKMVAVFREVKRVLKKEGTLWLNLGDSYSASGRGAGTKNLSAKQTSNTGSKHLQSHLEQLGQVGRNWVKPPEGFKRKELLGIPWRVAFALQDDGWYLRQDIIWHKPNPMPESVRDRCTKAHEYIFLLSKSPRYFFDIDAIKEPMKAVSIKRQKNGWNGDRQRTMPLSFTPHSMSHFGKESSGFRNKRSVWTVTTKPFKGAHFATFPKDLILPCVLAGAPINGSVLDPFMGAGTTGLVAKETQRSFVGIELNAEYFEIAKKRIGHEKALHD